MATNHNNPKSDNTTTIIRAVLFVAVLIVTAGIVIFLKTTGDVPLTPEGLAARDSIRHMAKPDTTTLPAAANPASSYEAADDSITTDVRMPSDAGYEDGYYAGITDGITGDERASYDESSQFPSADQRRTYADAYRRGYAQGYADGQEGKQFGIIEQNQDNDYEELNIE